MPRIRPSVFWQALQVHPFLPSLLSTCRDLHSARNELRWMVEHVQQNQRSPAYLRQCVRRRSWGEPLQYILGSEYFGTVEIKCRPGVLIPRPETAAAITYLAQRLNTTSLKNNRVEQLTLVDLCSGTGCIPILFNEEFHARLGQDASLLNLVGVDISSRAIALARENQIIQMHDRNSGSYMASGKRRSLQNCTFVHADVFSVTDKRRDFQRLLNGYTSPAFSGALENIILTANPPYISSRSFWHTTARSVRRFEPKLALVPGPSISTLAGYDGDGFYPELIRIGQDLQAAVLWFEVADLEQSRRVAQMIVKAGIWDHIEIWRDEPNHSNNPPEEELDVDGKKILIRGQGDGRSVFAFASNSQLIL